MIGFNKDRTLIQETAVSVPCETISKQSYLTFSKVM